MARKVELLACRSANEIGHLWKRERGQVRRWADARRTIAAAWFGFQSRIRTDNRQILSLLLNPLAI